MNYIKKIIGKIKDGTLREMLGEFKWIYNYGKRYKGAIIWYIFLGFVSTALGLVSSIVSKNIIDAVTGQDSGAIIPAAVFFVVMRLSLIPVNALTNRISTKIEIKVDQEIRADVYDKIMIADWQSMAEFHSGDLLNRLDNDVANVSSSVIGWVPELITRLIQFIGPLLIILYFDPTLAGLALLSAPVTLIVSRTLTKKMRKYNKKMREVSSEVMAFNEESFQNLQAIKAFGLTDVYGRKLRDVQQKFRDVKLDYNMFSIKTMSLMSLTGTIVSVLCFGWSVYRLWSGHITFGTMTLFLQMASALTGGFSSLASLFPQAISAATAAGRVMAVTELPKEDSDFEDETENLKKSKSGLTLEVNKIDFSYNSGKPVLKDVSFLAKPGEIIAVVGPSGEGKTTMLRILLGIVKASSGSVTISDENGTYQVGASTRKLFAYVPQGNTMFSGTVAENLRIMKKDATDEELDGVLKLACAYDFVHSLPDGLNSRILENGGGFSAGQIQRLSIARALLADAPILLLDEATSALDPETAKQIFDNIMKDRSNRTCIMTTHRPSVLEICERVYRISDENMRQLTKDEIDELIANP
ncbi:MAG: ABC transporter ATP-binding protein [Clostridia bacterium]|nr:ABC transporter ATP-binding protein [Clostridia bacterium]